MLQRGDRFIKRVGDENREAAIDEMRDHVTLIALHPSSFSALQLQPEHLRSGPTKIKSGQPVVTPMRCSR